LLLCLALLFEQFGFAGDGERIEVNFGGIFLVSLLCVFWLFGVLVLDVVEDVSLHVVAQGLAVAADLRGLQAAHGNLINDRNQTVIIILAVNQ
jgi:hypothetical protein